MKFAIHPEIYHTSPDCKGLIQMLENIWIKDRTFGEGVFYVVSAFSNYNGGVRFFETFRNHISKGGRCVFFLGGSTSQKLTSRQVVEKLLEVGCEVNIVQRNRLLHAKCYGHSSTNGDSLIISSGNFTGPGMSQNVEASILLREVSVMQMGFSWDCLVKNFEAQNWRIIRPDLNKKDDPVWELLYDESEPSPPIDNDREVTLIVILGDADTARIQADKDEKSGMGSQYFWLSKDSYDFFPPLTILNTKGKKATYSAIITLDYIDLGVKDTKCRVTFEAENNLDFRIGTGKLRYSKKAKSGDFAAITRRGIRDYELRIIAENSPEFLQLKQFASSRIGNKGKRFGYISNTEFARIIGDH